MALKFSDALRTARAQAISDFFSGGAGILRIYNGARPAKGAAITTQTLLSQHACSATFAGAPSNGVLTLNPVQTQSSAAATGGATWFRFLRADAATFVMDGDVSNQAGSGDLKLDDTNIVQNGAVAISSGIFTEGNG
jgi:hypothetical protein